MELFVLSNSIYVLNKCFARPPQIIQSILPKKLIPNPKATHLNTNKGNFLSNFIVSKSLKFNYKDTDFLVKYGENFFTFVPL